MLILYSNFRKMTNFISFTMVIIINIDSDLDCRIANLLHLRLLVIIIIPLIWSSDNHYTSSAPPTPH